MIKLFKFHFAREQRPMEEQLNEAKNLVLVSVFTTFIIFVGIAGALIFHVGYWEALKAFMWTILPLSVFMHILRIFRLLRWID